MACDLCLQGVKTTGGRCIILILLNARIPAIGLFGAGRLYAEVSWGGDYIFFLFTPNQAIYYLILTRCRCPTLVSSAGPQRLVRTSVPFGATFALFLALAQFVSRNTHAQLQSSQMILCPIHGNLASPLQRQRRPIGLSPPCLFIEPPTNLYVDLSGCTSLLLCIKRPAKPC